MVFLTAIRFTITDCLPGLNEYIDACRTDKFLGAKMKREAEERVQWAAWAQLRTVRFHGPVIMRYTWYEPNRKRDKDNIAFARKFIQDGLVKEGVLKNDGWSDIDHFSDSFAVDRENPRVELEIEEVTPHERGQNKDKV